MTYRSTTQQMKDRARIKAAKPACGICGEPIDYTLKWPDPRCFVVDHKIPLKRGGLDNITNKQAAHAECNSKKRARIVPPVIRRSGSLT